MKRRTGFTLVEIMIVVAIIGLLAAIAIPSFLKARQESKAKSCINNLRIMEAAKEQAATAIGWGAGFVITPGSAAETNVMAYIKNDSRPVCPSNGTYAWNAIGVNPTCSLGSGTPPHTL